MSKVTIIGMGNVGSTIAYKFASNLTASEIVLIDIEQNKARGEAMDIRQGLAYSGNVDIYAGTYSDAAGSDIVIITSGIGRKPGQTRLDLVKTNLEIIKGIISQIVKYCPDSKYIIVSNPVDILTYAFHKYSGLPENQIIGSGTILDTIRLRECIAQNYSVSSSNIHAVVLGEHGNSAVVPWSLASVAGVSADDFGKSVMGYNSENHSLNHEEIEEYVKNSGSTIIAEKGATYYAVSLGVSHIAKCILDDMKSILTVSTLFKGEYGISDVCLSQLAIIGENGIEGKICVPLTEEETEKLKASADAMKAVINDAIKD